MVWPSLQADFMLVETYKVELDSDSITVCVVVTVTVPLFRNQWTLHTCLRLIRLWSNCIQPYLTEQDLAWRAIITGILSSCMYAIKATPVPANVLEHCPKPFEYGQDGHHMGCMQFAAGYRFWHAAASIDCHWSLARQALHPRAGSHISALCIALDLAAILLRISRCKIRLMYVQWLQQFVIASIRPCICLTHIPSILDWDDHVHVYSQLQLLIVTNRSTLLMAAACIFSGRCLEVTHAQGVRTALGGWAAWLHHQIGHIIWSNERHSQQPVRSEA